MAGVFVTSVATLGVVAAVVCAEGAVSAVDNVGADGAVTAVCGSRVEDSIFCA